MTFTATVAAADTDERMALAGKLPAGWIDRKVTRDGEIVYDYPNGAILTILSTGEWITDNGNP